VPDARRQDARRLDGLWMTNAPFLLLVRRYGTETMDRPETHTKFLVIAHIDHGRPPFDRSSSAREPCSLARWKPVFDDMDLDRASAALRSRRARTIL